jgi:hypothetical protein
MVVLNPRAEYPTLYASLYAGAGYSCGLGWPYVFDSLAREQLDLMRRSIFFTRYGF